MRWALVGTDSGLFVVAVLVATWLRYDFSFGVGSWARTAALLVTGAAVLVVTGTLLGLYTGRWMRGTLDEARALAVAVAAGGACLFPLDLLLGRPVPAGAALVAAPMALVVTAPTRVVRRPSRPRRPGGGSPGHRVVVFGAGQGARDVVGAMLRDRTRAYAPVALLDDDPAKAGLHLHGVRVWGSRADVRAVADRTGADTLLIAVPSADSGLVRDLTDRGAAAGLTVRVLPPVSELFEDAPGVHHIRPVSCADLLGRHEVQVDLDSIAGYVTGRRVLVTGAGGSIGSELCRQLRQYAPARLAMLDRDESALHALQLSVEGRAMLDERSLVVADIRDRSRMERVFAEHAPEVVFHAAALKHLPLLQMHPEEAVKTNVLGTLDLLSVAVGAGVRWLVNISTDKAADPISVLGYSKRIAERLTAWFDAHAGGLGEHRYVSVRFGNVLGSRGSVLTAFRQQLADGNPLTVTHPDVTRYFMTVEEAVHLVIQAGAVGAGGEVLVLDMGEPVRIAEVAQRLIAQSGRAVGMEFTGLRPGEKLHECLLGAGEHDHRPVHPLISQVRVPPLSPAEVYPLSRLVERDVVTEALRTLSVRPPRGAAPDGDGAVAAAAGNGVARETLRR